MHGRAILEEGDRGAAVVGVAFDDRRIPRFWSNELSDRALCVGGSITWRTQVDGDFFDRDRGTYQRGTRDHGDAIHGFAALWTWQHVDDVGRVDLGPSCGVSLIKLDAPADPSERGLAV